MFPSSGSAAHLQPGEEFIFTALCQPREIECRSTRRLYYRSYPYAAHHGSFDDVVPLILNGDVSRPYRNIELRASLPAARISVNPGHIVVQPVPLRAPIIAKFTICVEYFTRYAHSNEHTYLTESDTILCSPMDLSVSLPTVDSGVNLVVTFPEDSAVYNADGSKKTEISCQLEFSSTKPISKSDYIIVTDKTSDIRYNRQIHMLGVHFVKKTTVVKGTENVATFCQFGHSILEVAT